MDVDALVVALGSHSYRFSNEIELQDGIATVMTQQGFNFAREVDLGKKDRIDFLVDVPTPILDGLPILIGDGCKAGVEVKIRETLANVTRQLHRYAQSDRIDVLVFACTSRRLCATIPRVLAGKRVVPVALGGVL